MSKLNDTQSMLLANAARTRRTSLYPLPTSLMETTEPAARAIKAIAALVKLGFAEERETCVNSEVHRIEGNFSYGLFATAAGFAAIGVEAGDDSEPGTSLRASTKKEAQPTSKRNAVLDLLRREGGATTAELITATGWLPHTTRAAVTGLRKQGHVVERSKRGEETCYRITA